VREAEVERQLLALRGGLETDAVDVEGLLVALADTLHHVVDGGAGGAPLRARALGFALGLHPDLAVGDAGFNVVAGVELQLAQLALHRDELAGHGDGDAAGNGDWIFAYT